MVAAPSSGTHTPDAPEAFNVHPTSARRPYPIVVQSEHTSYTDAHITSKFVNRGAEVVSGPDGQLLVTPTEKVYELQTERAVPKTGLVPLFFFLNIDEVSPLTMSPVS
jgi:myo-inositol-1-phosphate synthase